MPPLESGAHMPIVTVQLMEGVLSPDQKKTLIGNIVDAVADVYGGRCVCS
jgi:phenylpyruvate tautomerase PptA (4-oxalocrotonate tautomerase family)